MSKKYYTASTKHGWHFGVLYTYDETGNKEIVLYRTEPMDTREEAMDSIAEYLEENNIDADLG